MTVKKLIAMLKNFDDNDEVKLMVDGEDYCIDGVGNIGMDDCVYITDISDIF